MSLSPDSKVTHYRIVSKLGAGGMGEVYRAHDSRLNREVAIKVLPREFADDSDRLQRFQQEAQATSALNHPNILTVYDIGEHEGSPFIVAELLEGEELRERLNEGPIPLRKISEYAQQIVSGLAAAHERGIVHRDLKPENIFITKEDRVKILDFGLAKLREPETGPSSSEDATRKVLTNPGVVMGTIGYMSPEQVRAQVLDHRSDIFSFGSILHEMITGRRAFQRETMAETMSAIMKEEPEELTESNSHVSPALERLVRRCLEKKPERRFQSTSDLGFALESMSGATSSSGTTVSAIAPQTETARTNRKPLLLAMGILLLVAGVIAGAFATNYFRTSSIPTYQQLTFRRGIIKHARFAPDGQTLVYSASWIGNPLQIFSTTAGSSESRALGFGDADILAISSSGELAILLKRTFLGQFVSSGTLARVPLGGGAPREIVENVTEADWSPDGASLAVARYVNGRHRLEYPVGKMVYETAGYISYPRVSPKGDQVAFVDHEIQWDNRGRVAVIDQNGKKTFLSTESTGQEGLAWSADGSEVWFTSSQSGDAQALYATTLSAKTRPVVQIPGDLLLHDIARDGRVLLTRNKMSADLISLPPGETRERDLTWLDIGGVDDLSADGKTFLYQYWGENAGKNYSVYLGKTDGSPAVRLGDGGNADLSPDGKWVVAVQREPPRLVLLPTGAGEMRVLEKHSIDQYNLAKWFPDGKRIMFVGREAGHLDRCYIQQIDSGGPQPITPEGVYCTEISPDGKSVIGYDSAGTASRATQNKPAIYSIDGGVAKPIPGLTEKENVSDWNADGSAVYVYSVEGFSLKISRLEIATGRKEPLREVTPADTAGLAQAPAIILTPDGKGYIYTTRRYLMDLYLAKGLK